MASRCYPPQQHPATRGVIEAPVMHVLGEISMEIRLTPTGQLRWEAHEGGTASTVLASLQKAFQADWREGLFTLAAEKLNLDAPTLRYWQALAERYLTGLCHIPGATETFEVVAPSSADCASPLLTAPPIQGGEYRCGVGLQYLL